MTWFHREILLPQFYRGIHAITGIVLEELLARVEAGMAHALPVPFYFMVEEQFHRELL